MRKLETQQSKNATEGKTNRRTISLLEEVGGYDVNSDITIYKESPLNNHLMEDLGYVKKNGTVGINYNTVDLDLAVLGMQNELYRFCENHDIPVEERPIDEARLIQIINSTDNLKLLVDRLKKL
jgi:hypothetical protein